MPEKPTVCAICQESVERLFESEWNGALLCGKCWDVEQEEFWGNCSYLDFQTEMALITRGK